MSKKTSAERVKYILFSGAFYFLLLKDSTGRVKNADVSSSGQAGDDIYPLF